MDLRLFLFSCDDMTRSKLINKANKSREEVIKAYTKQKNLVLNLNRKAKKGFLKNCFSNDSKVASESFWKKIIK